jgi:signal transduction histidine kinase
VPIPSHLTNRRRTEEARLRIVRLAADPGRPLDDLWRAITRIAADTLDVERAGVWLFTDDRTAIRCACLFERTEGAYSDGLTLRVADFPDYFAAMADRKALPAENAATDPRTVGLMRAYLDPLGISSLLDAPIWLNGQIVGVACHEHVGPPREWTTEERDFAGSVADFIALKIKGAQLADAKRPKSSDSGVLRRTQDATIHFAAGLAHDLRNLLTIVIGNGDMIIADRDTTPGLRDKARSILAAADRGLALANELGEIGGHRAGRPRILGAVEEIRNLLPVLQAAAKDRHPVTLVAPDAGDRIFADPVQLERILLNLVLNARDAMPDGGPIEIRVVEGLPAVEIAVRDAGTGIEPALIERIFDPYVTTKPKGQGTGIGLTVVKRMVELAGGTIRVESVLGRGTTVRIALPRASAGVHVAVA